MQDGRLPEIIVLQETLLCLQICTSIPPESIDLIPSKLSPAGTEAGWQIPDFGRYPEYKPVRCADYEYRWHYVLMC